MFALLQRLLSGRKARRGLALRVPPSRRLCLEALEDRALPAPIGVAVIDTGVDLGRADMPVAGGYDAVYWDNKTNFYDDDNSHGTHVAGIVHQVAPNAAIYAVKVLDASGSGPQSSIEAGLQWVIDNQASKNIWVVNLSLGDGTNNPADQGNLGYYNKINALEALGVTVVSAAANNYYSFQTPGSSAPGSVSTLDVGAVWAGDFGAVKWTRGPGPIDYTTAADRIVSFSQRDPNNPQFVLGPGAMIRSTVPVELDPDAVKDGYTEYSGTSMASPYVAGVVVRMQETALSVTGTGRYLETVEVVDLLRQSSYSVYDGDDENDNVVNTNRSYSRVSPDATVTTVSDYLTSGVGVHDVDVVSVGLPAGPVSAGVSVPVTVVVTNAGTFDESFSVSLISDNGTPGVTTDDVRVGTWTVDLPKGESATLSRPWNTAGAKVGTHILSARWSLTDSDGDESASAFIAVTPASKPGKPKPGGGSAGSQAMTSSGGPELTDLPAAGPTPSVPSTIALALSVASGLLTPPSRQATFRDPGRATVPDTREDEAASSPAPSRNDSGLSAEPHPAPAGTAGSDEDVIWESDLLDARVPCDLDIVF